MAMLSPIPLPPTVPFLGNATLIDIDVPIRSFLLLARQYGEIYQLTFSGRVVVVHVNSAAMVRQISDDQHFRKSVSRGLREVRNLAGDGLFTAEIDEPNWGIAHRILLPAFGAANIRNMFPDMQDICSQLLLKWERFGPRDVFDPSEDYTRLTFDTIALCSMSYRFNSFYERDLPIFTREMAEFLASSNRRAFRPSFAKMIPLYYKTEDEKYFEEVKHMTEVAREIIRQRKEQPTRKADLLTLMLEGKDPRTEARLSEDNIIYNLLTFLIAGHETTSGLLTFATYYLLKNPPCLQKLREELDDTLGYEEPTIDDLGKMPYLTAVMRETLRLSPPAPARSVVPRQDTELIGGDGDRNNPNNKKYAVKKDQLIFVHAVTAQRDPLVWGDDAEMFRPERMLNGKFESLPEQAWQPFGFGARACIGRAFAWQEALLVLASVFSKFDLYFQNASYTLEIKQNLTIKPKDMLVRAVPRTRESTMGRTSRKVEPRESKQEVKAKGAAKEEGHPLYVLYGSNTGTSQAFAQRIATAAAIHGFKAQVNTLDSGTDRLPVDVPVVIITASFEGEPADNAAQFIAWLSCLRADGAQPPLSRVVFAVFGCGNREWTKTYQRVPRLIDENLASMGAKRLVERGEGDASAADFFQKFDEFEDNMWRVLEKKYQVERADKGDAGTSGISVELAPAGTKRAKTLRQTDAALGEVLENRILTKPGAPEKRHIEIKVPEGMSYRAGDYLAIIPSSPEEAVQRVLSRFKLSSDQEITIEAKGSTTLPVGVATTIHTLLCDFVELSQPATTRDLQTLKGATSNEVTVATLDALLEEYPDEVLAKRISVLDLLEQHPDIDIPFATFLNLLPTMRIRQYSISSSPLIDAGRASLTVSIVDAPALSGIGNARFKGVASTYLARLKQGDHISVFVRPSGSQFTLPSDPLTPIVMFAAGSGLAPFRGFIQERAAQKAAGRDVGPAVLFFGCRAPGEDYLYMDAELKEWVGLGAVEIRPAFSRKADASEGCQYVQHRIWHDRQLITDMYDEHARFYTCGSRRVANGIKQACINIIKNNHPDWDEERMEAAWEKVQKERYAADVFD